MKNPVEHKQHNIMKQWIFVPELRALQFRK